MRNPSNAGVVCPVDGRLRRCHRGDNSATLLNCTSASRFKSELAQRAAPQPQRHPIYKATELIATRGRNPVGSSASCGLSFRRTGSDQAVRGRRRVSAGTDIGSGVVETAKGSGALPVTSAVRPSKHLSVMMTCASFTENHSRRTGLGCVGNIKEI